VFEPFKKLVSKSDFPEYYEQIEHATALQPILGRVQGRIRGKRATGSSEFQTWDELAAEVAFIWVNCRSFNEDGSDIVNDVNLFEVSIPIHSMSSNAPNLLTNQTGDFQRPSCRGQSQSSRAQWPDFCPHQYACL
jgi:hypothetical protein